MPQLRTNLHKSLCGLLVALALLTLPLPASAVEELSGGADPASTSSTAAATTTEESTVSTNNSEAAADGPSLTLSDASVQTNTPTLQTSTSDTTAEETAPTSQQTETTATNQSKATAGTAAGRIENNINSDATSGSVAVTGNETAANAKSGTANATATVVNVANTNGATAGAFNIIECNVTEDTQENLVIDPSSLLPICESTTIGSTQAGASTGGIQTGASLTDILNNIVLNAISGDATSSNNGTVGNTTTGDAAAVANIVNIANTAISANQSFLGVVNIHSNLTGNILVPQSLVDTLIQNNGGVLPAGTATANIANNIDASAVSGNTTTSNNGTVGDTTSGDATTSLTVMNLTGQEVVAKNSLLVFVNVLGKWMGMIVPAPGSNTALLGSGVQGNTGTVSSGTLANSTQTTANITNNISVQAQSGNATVTGNEQAGNATSGKASAGVNLLNITDSNFRLGDWFGALFINVLGSWLGNFDIKLDTPPADSGPIGSRQPVKIVQGVQVFQFNSPATVTMPAATKRTAAMAASAPTQASGSAAVSATPTGAVLGTSTTTKPDSSDNGQGTKFDLVSLGAIVAALTLLIAVSGMAFRNWHSA